MPRLRLASRLLAVAAFLIAVCPWNVHAAERSTVKVGFIITLFRNLPEALLKELMTPFKTLMETSTGLPLDMVTSEDHHALAQLLNSGRVRFGVFQGYEYAWVKEHCPELKPLLIAVNQDRVQHACLVVREDSRIASFGDLKGKSLALLRYTREHCLQYLERNCGKEGCKTPKEFFTAVYASPTVERALEGVLRGAAQVALVEAVSLEAFKQRKPELAKKLKVFQSSEAFPATVVVYHPKHVDAATVKQFKEGLLNANKTQRGQEILVQCRMTNFDEIPADYDETLETILKAYPAPAHNGK